MTYGDGLADVDVAGLIKFHRAEGCLATVTAVRPPGRFGRLDLNGNRARGFQEKPRGDGDWINGGFFVLEPAALDAIPDDDTLWEKDPMQDLAAAGQLAAFRHGGFWQPMDTLRDKTLLEELWAGGRAPWKLW
jgi:glucose-1-phosphate cytidylyltransferase